jgi:hypothetical protein
MHKSIDRVLNLIRAALDDADGVRFARVMLFGSRARWVAHPNWDHDRRASLREVDNFGQEVGQIAEIETEILYDGAAPTHAVETRGLRGNRGAQFSTRNA